jgi:flagellar hook-basal body complex protein FliE
MLPIQNAAALLESVLQARTPEATADAAVSSGDGVFGGMWKAAAHQIQETDAKAQQAVTGLLSGNGVDVHDAAIATQQSDLTFELALQIRNKAVAAYQQMMTMQF